MPILAPASITALSLYPPTIFIRAAAQNIDVIVAALFAFGLSWAVRLIGIPESAAGALGFTTFVAGFLLADALPGGQSPGKRAFGLSVVVSSNGAPCTPARSIFRNAFVVLGLVDWAFMLGRTRRRLGDHAAGTRVVRIVRAA
jgi:uncharacterized RDD family membrane protein YckC